ncbi:MAG: DUF992 domain-containing protein [Rhizobiaceae bacterium]|jgi:hypothetical protein|nr:MAG: DUF992 domain-containing protein [Rhizobiaceae bacterium]
MKRILVAGAAALSFLSLPALAATHGANEAQRLGRLQCTISGGIGAIIGSRKRMDCTFTPANPHHRVEKYYGTVSKFGLDIGVTNKAVMQWLVLAPTKAWAGPGALAGTYRGASANASAVVGGGANVLIGGSHRSFTLQPVSVQAQTGINLAVGVSSFRLRVAR